MIKLTGAVHIYTRAPVLFSPHAFSMLLVVHLIILRQQLALNFLICCYFYRRGFEKAFELLAGESRTGCQAIIVLVTDGKDTDGEHVRCGPGKCLTWRRIYKARGRQNMACSGELGNKLHVTSVVFYIQFKSTVQAIYGQ